VKNWKLIDWAFFAAYTAAVVVIVLDSLGWPI
jgi:hypothetical protein